MIPNVIILSVVMVACIAQRPFYARRPIGYPVIEEPSTESNDLGNRFGNVFNGTTTTTQRLPIEALGDRELVDRLSKFPKDKQPFWLLNWQALEQNRRQGQTYQHGLSNIIKGVALFNDPAQKV